MAASRMGPRRVIVCSIAFISFIALFYEFIHVSDDRFSINSFSPRNYSLPFRVEIPLVKNFLSTGTTTSSAILSTKTKTALVTRSNTERAPPSPPVTTTAAATPAVTAPTLPTTMAPAVVSKLKIIYGQVNMSETSTPPRSIFPAFQIGHYVMLNPFICSDAPVIDVIIIVHTAPDNFVKRNRMRTTFADRKLYFPKQVRIAFLLGRPKNKELVHDLQQEHVTYNDTIMGDFMDDYHNLTLKGVMGFHWVGEYCSNSKVVLKLDDDVVVDVYKLLSRYMPHMDGKHKSIFCNLWRKNMGILRDGKWKVPHRFFRGMEMFPYNYCSGFTVLLTTDLMKPLYKAARVAPFFWIDDLYLFGMLPRIVGGVTYHEYRMGNNVSLSPRQTMDCWTLQGLDCSIFSSIFHYDETSELLWRQVQFLHNNTKIADSYVRSVFEP